MRESFKTNNVCKESERMGITGGQKLVLIGGKWGLEGGRKHSNENNDHSRIGKTERREC